MDNKNSIWSKQILEMQQEDGTWGLQFHTLSIPTKKYPLTTEQALRRLMILGFDVNDLPIRKTVNYMTACLRGERKMDNSWDKSHNFPLFTKLMLSTWIKIFEPDNEFALAFASRWAEVIEKTFKHGKYDHNEYVNAYTMQFVSKPKGGREVDFSTFYHISLLQGMLTPKTESLMLDYVISKPEGIYYISSGPLNIPPKNFAAKNTSWYFAALEILSGYDLSNEKLGFAVDWINMHKDADGQWDFGTKANDGVYFPYSNSWRKAEDRKADCTYRVMALLKKWL